MGKICDLRGVREYSEHLTVELWRDGEAGRLVVLARNQDGFDCTKIDLLDLVQWLQFGPMMAAIGTIELPPLCDGDHS